MSTLPKTFFRSGKLRKRNDVMPAALGHLLRQRVENPRGFLDEAFTRLDRHIMRMLRPQRGDSLVYFCGLFRVFKPQRIRLVVTTVGGRNAQMNHSRVSRHL